MREIKFRAWDKANKCWIWEPRWKVCYNDANTELMQFTGLKDKNGKEIYEGDILEENIDGVVRGKVIFDFGVFGVDFNKLGRYPINDRFLYGSPTVEIIGNIYENPELLENK